MFHGLTHFLLSDFLTYSLPPFTNDAWQPLEFGLGPTLAASMHALLSGSQQFGKPHLLVLQMLLRI